MTAEEKRLKDLFIPGSTIIYHEKPVTIVSCDKPIYSKGEGKTDIYILLNTGEEIKISAKQSNADFLQNKITAEWYEANFNNYSYLQDIINKAKPKFLNKQVYYPTAKGRIQANSHTIGWRLDLINKASGELCIELDNITMQQRKAIYYGINLTSKNKDAKINNKIVPNSGIANCLLLNSERYNTAQDIINNLTDVNESDKIFATFRAVNYRQNEDKIEGCRTLAVPIIWTSKTDYQIVFDKPLQYKAGDLLKTYKEVFFK